MNIFLRRDSVAKFISVKMESLHRLMCIEEIEKLPRNYSIEKQEQS
jgi:hypothetical protein